MPHSDDFNDGYEQGKNKAYFEIAEIVHRNDHAADCGCRPCIVIRSIVERVLEVQALTIRDHLITLAAESYHAEQSPLQN